MCLATLLYELLLTRVFSVTTFYHFAFMAVSVAMFGMTVGAIAVYLRPGLFPATAVHARLGLAALLFAAALVPSLLGHLVVPFAPVMSVLGVYSVALTYVFIAIPFVFSGIVVSVALTRFPAQVGMLYAADLIGGALACLLFVQLSRVTDAPTAAILIAAVAGAAAICFAPRRSRTRRAAAALTALFCLWGSTVVLVSVPFVAYWQNPQRSFGFLVAFSACLFPVLIVSAYWAAFKKPQQIEQPSAADATPPDPRG